MAEQGSLAGKVALVTGGSRGIGAAICIHLARAGATVLVNYSSSESAARAVADQIKAGGGDALILKANVSDSKQVEGLFKQIDKSHGGRLDILVNNAGVYLPAALADSTEADFDKTFDVNVKSLFLVTKQAIDRLPDGGRIINIGSIVGERVPFPGASVYAASKFAVAGFTRAWARELAVRADHGQRRAARADRYRHESGRCRHEPRRRLLARGDSAGTLWHRRRDRRAGRVPCFATGRLHLGSHDQRRRWPDRIV